MGICNQVIPKVMPDSTLFHMIHINILFLNQSRFDLDALSFRENCKDALQLHT